MKSFFISIAAAIGSFFGFHSTPAQQPQNPPAATMQTYASSSSTPSAATSLLVTVGSNSAATSAPQVTPHLIQQSLTEDSDNSQLVITFPAGSDILHPGQTYTVTWQHQGSTPIIYSVYLEYILNGVYNKLLLGSVSSEQQTFAFKVPTNTEPRSNYQLYFYDSITGNPMVGSQAFTIK